MCCREQNAQVEVITTSPDLKLFSKLAEAQTSNSYPGILARCWHQPVTTCMSVRLKPWPRQSCLAAVDLKASHSANPFKIRIFM